MAEKIIKGDLNVVGKIKAEEIAGEDNELVLSTNGAKIVIPTLQGEYVHPTGNYSPTETYYLYSGGNYVVTTAVTEANYNTLKPYLYIYKLIGGESYVKVQESDTFDPNQTYYLDNYDGTYTEFEEATGEKVTLENFDDYKDYLYILQDGRANIVFPQKSGMVIVADSTPTTAGTYKLQCVVDSDGNPTFSWVADN